MTLTAAITVATLFLFVFSLIFIVERTLASLIKDLIKQTDGLIEQIDDLIKRIKNRARVPEVYSCRVYLECEQCHKLFNSIYSTNVSGFDSPLCPDCTEQYQLDEEHNC